MELELVLKNYGLNEKQIKIYLTLLQMGSSTINEISLKTDIKRTTAYSVLDSLFKQKLIYYDQKKTHRFYYAEDPNKISTILKDKVNNLITRNSQFIGVIPELNSLYNQNAKKPKIRFYEGLEGIKQVFEETLLVKPGVETLAYASAEKTNQYLSAYIEDYMKRRSGSGIPQRAITEDSPFSRILQKRDKEHLRQLVLVKKEQFPFKDQIDIFGNKIFIASFTDLTAILIESQSAADTQKAIFELAWIGAKQVGIQSPNQDYKFNKY